MDVEGLNLMDLLHAHDKDRRAEGARGFFTSFTLFLATTGVGVALLTAPTQVVTATSDPSPSPQITRLERENTAQAAEIERLRTLFTTCVNNGSCVAPADTGPVTVSRPTVIHSRDTDDDSDPVVIRETTTKVIQQPAPKPTMKPSPKPDPKPRETSNPNRVKQTTDIPKNAVTGVLDRASKATKAGKK